ncbi:clathrin heavy chain linker domain-containing protein 1 isoform 1-T1 [Ciconia maguari]
MRRLLPESRMAKGMHFFLHGRLKALESESTTLLYYRKRAMELEDKYARILLVANAISAWAKSDKIVTLQDLSQIMKNKKDERDDCFFLLENCPSSALIGCLSQQWIRKPPFSPMGATILFCFSRSQKAWF